jgi:hypothetical protein
MDLNHWHVSTPYSLWQSSPEKGRCLPSRHPNQEASNDLSACVSSCKSEAKQPIIIPFARMPYVSISEGQFNVSRLNADISLSMPTVIDFNLLMGTSSLTREKYSMFIDIELAQVLEWNSTVEHNTSPSLSFI